MTQIEENQCVRFEEIIFQKRISRKQFATLLGVSIGYVNALVSKSKPLTKTIIDGVARNWPDINIDWLIHGTGSMIRGEVNEPPISYEKSAGLTIAGWMENIERQVGEMRQEIKELRQAIAQKKEVISN